MKITDKILSAWIDDRLSPEKMSLVSASVQSDPQMKARAEALRDIGRRMREEPVEIPVSAERMAADVRRAIRQRQMPQTSRSPLWLPAAVTACACLLLAAALLPSMIHRSAPLLQAEIESVNSGLSGVSTMVYTDYDAGWTVVWLDGVELEPGS